MEFVMTLFEPVLLIFTVPLLVATGLCLMAMMGLFDIDADADVDLDVDPDVDADLDADADAGMSANLLYTLGVGRVPLSLLVVLLLFGFGLTGLVLHATLGAVLGGQGWDGTALNLAFAPAALLVGVVTMALVARPLGKLFHGEGKAHRAAALVGKVAVLRSSTITTTFGSAVVKVDGDLIEVDVRSDTDVNALGYGDRVLIFNFDPERNLYFVAPYEEDDALRLPSKTL